MVNRGASIWTVPGSNGLVCPVAAAAGSPTSSTQLAFRFPRAVFLTGLLALPQPNVAFATLQAQCAQLSLHVVDEVNQPLVSDSRGTLQGTTLAPVAAPFLLLFGRAFHPFKLQRPLAASDRWLFTIQNADPVNAQTLAGLFLYFSEPDGR